MPAEEGLLETPAPSYLSALLAPEHLRSSWQVLVSVAGLSPCFPGPAQQGPHPLTEPQLEAEF